jgi:hypothetical protein
MATDPARVRLAQAQLALVQALARQADIPAVFNAAQVQAAADALVQKRARTLARAWPGLWQALGLRFMEQFARFAATAAVPGQGGPLADGRAFVGYLAARGELPAEGRLEALAVDLRYEAVADGLVWRRWPAVRAGWFGRRYGLIVAVRVPWLGEKWWALGRKA